MDEPKGVEEARKELGRYIDLAHFQGECTWIRKNNGSEAVLVPREWYVETERRRQDLLREQRPR